MLEFDAKGELNWADAELREWVQNWAQAGSATLPVAPAAPEPVSGPAAFEAAAAAEPTSEPAPAEPAVTEPLAAEPAALPQPVAGEAMPSPIEPALASPRSHRSRNLMLVAIVVVVALIAVAAVAMNSGGGTGGDSDSAAPAAEPAAAEATASEDTPAAEPALTRAEYAGMLKKDRARLLDAMAWVVSKGAAGTASKSAFEALWNRSFNVSETWWDVEPPASLATTDKAWHKAIDALGTIDDAPPNDFRRLRPKMAECLRLLQKTGGLAGNADCKAVTSGLAQGLWVQSPADVFKASCRTVAYKVLDKDAGQLKGRKYKITGQVFQIQDAGSGQYWEGYPAGLEPRTSILLSVTNQGYGFWDDNVAVAFEGRLKKVYEKDIITVWGTCLGQYSYTSVAGYDMTVPAILAKYVSKN